MNRLGLGHNSTVPSVLKSAGKSGSRSWAYAAGGQAAGQDGSLILGGYDRARIRPGSKRHMQPIYPLGEGPGCGAGLVASIHDVILNFRNGTNVSVATGYEPQVAQSSSAYVACIMPEEPVVASFPGYPWRENLYRLTCPPGPQTVTQPFGGPCTGPHNQVRPYAPGVPL
jgi:hypothetical protein